MPAVATSPRFTRAAVAGLTIAILLAARCVAQVATNPTKLPAITVSAQKESQSLQTTPASVTAVPRNFLEDAGIQLVNDAAAFAPNTYLTEWSARKLSNPRFRGIGSSPNNPGVTTYLDGVPQLNANTSSLEFIDVEQVEIVRGPQGALFGRNTVGGLININSLRPSLTQPAGGASVGFGNHGWLDARFNVSQPVASGTAAVSLAAGYSSRDGFARNSVTGHDLDWRKAQFGKAQAVWQLNNEWDARAILAGERSRDGDYRLNDLLQVRAHPDTMSRDFEGFTHRDVLAPTLILSRRRSSVEITSTTGAIAWKTLDVTDLDYSIAPLLERTNAEKGFQFTQELRFASAKAARDLFSWQAGIFYFAQEYEQDAFNFFANPAFLRYPVGTPAFRRYSRADLDDRGVGVFGQANYQATETLSVSLGLRGDWESKDAVLNSFTAPAGLGAATRQNLSDHFHELSPHVVASTKVAPDQMAYASIARGYKAGGFNGAAPAGAERYGQEKSWNYEAGYKASWLGNRLRTNLSVYHARWNDMQLNVPSAVPGEFYISNVGAARSQGVEFEVTARPAAGLDLFGGAGLMSAKFRGGSRSDGVAVGGLRLPFSPDYTASGGAQYTFAVEQGLHAFVRGEVLALGKFYYTDQNVRSQGAYSLANFRAGLRGRQWSLEAWARNAFDEGYVQIAIPYSLAPSGFIGEAGAPRMIGLSASYRF